MEQAPDEHMEAFAADGVPTLIALQQMLLKGGAFGFAQSAH
jgi:hypothetical protein